MADKDYNYTVFPSDLKPFGPVGKENLDIIRLSFDFSCYLETSELIQAIEFPTIAVLSASSTTNNNWRQDFPVECEATTEDVEDKYTLTVTSESITGSGKVVQIMLHAGTPRFSYVLSFVAIASATRRRKQVDTIINIEDALNPAMLSPGQVDPLALPPIIITDTTALPMGYDGLVILQNSGNKYDIVVTLPPNPVIGQMLEFIDAYGKDGTYPVTFRGDGDVPIDGDGRTIFVSSINYDCLRWKWTGANWHLMAMRFDWLA